MSILQQIACGTAWECKENEDVEAAELADVEDHQAERNLGGDEVLKNRIFSFVLKEPHLKWTEVRIDRENVNELERGKDVGRGKKSLKSEIYAYV